MEFNHSKRAGTPFIFITFSVAMAFLEAAVVIYLRALYYPEGFAFPLKMMDTSIAWTELFREVATIIMLLAAGMLAGKNTMERIAWFILGFAIWDIFYYVFLKLLIGWPASFMTWDLLFLIPLTWVGPVICPIINAITMILLSFFILRFSALGKNAILHKTEWLLLIAGSAVVIIAYTEEYARFLMRAFSFTELLSGDNKNEVLSYAQTYIPQKFNWIVFLAGVTFHWIAITSYYFRNRKS